MCVSQETKIPIQENTGKIELVWALKNHFRNA